MVLIIAFGDMYGSRVGGHGSGRSGCCDDRVTAPPGLVDTSWLALEVFDTADKTVRY